MCSFNDSLLVVTSPHKLQEYKIFTDTDTKIAFFSFLCQLSTESLNTYKMEDECGEESSISNENYSTLVKMETDGGEEEVSIDFYKRMFTHCKFF